MQSVVRPRAISSHTLSRGSEDRSNFPECASTLSGRAPAGTRHGILVGRQNLHLPLRLEPMRLIAPVWTTFLLPKLVRAHAHLLLCEIHLCTLGLRRS